MCSLRSCIYLLLDVDANFLGISMTTGGDVTVDVGVVVTKRFCAIVFARSATRKQDRRMDLPQSHWIRRRLSPVK